MALERDNAPFCTICRRRKQQTNHWWLIVLECMNAGIHFVHWDEEVARVADGCACGEACSHIALSRWMETGTLDAPTTRNEVLTERIA